MNKNKSNQLDRKRYKMTNNITIIEKNTTGITKAFANIVIETKDDIINYMNIATTLTESANFAKAWVLKLAKENVFKGVNNETIKYAEEKFGIKRASTLQYIKLANEYLIDATRTKLCGYYFNNKFVSFVDSEIKPENVNECDVIDFTYTQIAVMMAKGLETIQSLIVDGVIVPWMKVNEIKKALNPVVEADFTENTETTTETETAGDVEKSKNAVTMYVDNNGTKHTFDEITATDSDKTVFFKTVGEFAVTVEISLLDIDSEEATAKITKYIIEK